MDLAIKQPAVAYPPFSLDAISLMSSFDQNGRSPKPNYPSAWQTNWVHSQLATVEITRVVLLKIFCKACDTRGVFFVKPSYSRKAAATWALQFKETCRLHVSDKQTRPFKKYGMRPRREVLQRGKGNDSYAGVAVFATRLRNVFYSLFMEWWIIQARHFYTLNPLCGW